MQISFNNALKKPYLKEKINKEKFENFLNLDFAIEFVAVVLLRKIRLFKNFEGLSTR